MCVSESHHKVEKGYERGLKCQMLEAVITAEADEGR